MKRYDPKDYNDQTHYSKDTNVFPPSIPYFIHHQETLPHCYLITTQSLQNKEHCGWDTNESGEEIIVVSNPIEFAHKILPRYFDHTNIKTFIRQLNNYRFAKAGEAFCYMHPYFKRNQKHLLSKVNIPKKHDSSIDDVQIVEAIEKNKKLRAQLHIAVKEYEEELKKRKDVEDKVLMIESVLNMTFTSMEEETSNMSVIQPLLLLQTSLNDAQSSTAVRSNTTSEEIIQGGIIDKIKSILPLKRKLTSTTEIADSLISHEQHFSQSCFPASTFPLEAEASLPH